MISVLKSGPKWVRDLQFNIWRYSEVRSVFEWQSFYLLRPLLKRLPQGDGHPVIVFPGFVGSDASTQPLRRLLDDLGYKTYGWGMGRNLLFNQEREAQMRNLVDNVYEAEGRKVTLIGWSLGGLFAREIAKANPDIVRGVISMGSPISAHGGQTNARELFKAINGTPSSGSGRFRNINQPPMVPTTSIYSKTDGIVHWRSSVQHEHPLLGNHQIENIEVPASHLGLGVNAFVMYALADRLAQPEGSWLKFDRSGFRSLLYRAPKELQIKGL